MLDLIWENATLQTVVKNLWRSHQYSLVYQMFLLGTLSEGEFRAIAEKFASAYQKESDNQLTHAVTFLLDSIDQRLTSLDLSLLLNVDPADIEKVLKNSNLQKSHTHDQP